MITYTARINLLAENGSLSSVTSNLSGNNISSDIGAILGVRKQSTNPFIIGASKIGDGSTFSNSVDYFIGNQLSTASGAFSTPYTFTVRGSNIGALTITFDNTNNRYPNTVVIDETSYELVSPTLSKVLSSANSHTITIDNWNSPNYPLVITGLYADIEITIDRRKLLNFNFTKRSISDNAQPVYGVIANDGEMNLIDYDKDIRYLATQNLLKPNRPLEIMLNGKLIASFDTDKWTYENSEQRCAVTMKDRLLKMQEVEYERNLSSPTTAMTILKELVAKTEELGISVVRDSVNTNTGESVFGDYYNDITIEFPYIDKCTLWEAWDKFAQLTRTHIHSRYDGSMEIRQYGV